VISLSKGSGADEVEAGLRLESDAAEERRRMVDMPIRDYHVNLSQVGNGRQRIAIYDQNVGAFVEFEAARLGGET
jgi:hypothetical protein